MLVVDLVGEAAPAPEVDGLHLATAQCDLVVHLVEHRLDAGIVDFDVDDDHELIGPHGELPPSGPGASASGPRGCGAGFNWTSGL